MVKTILKNKQKLRAFREMVVMHVKKNDLQTKLLADDFDKITNDIVIPLSAFKQSLQVIGVNLSPQVSDFEVESSF